nr:uncharacterized protein LOC113393630 [Vanessa tameamea]
MLSSQFRLTVFSDCRCIPKYINRYKSDICESDLSKSKKSEDTLCELCRAIPCECNPSAPTMYDKRKYGHNLPCDNITPQFETLPHFPKGIFRCTDGETLGRGADKCSFYQNPEYFSYHHMTFYDMHMFLRSYRKPSAESGRKP